MDRLELTKSIEEVIKIMKKEGILQSPYVDGWEGLSEYMGGTAKRTLQNWEKEGLIQKYKIGKRVFFKKEEIDKSLTLVER